jgi:hypothetical protein
MFFATVRTILKGPYNEHYAAVSHNFKTTASRSHSKRWPQRHCFSYSTRCTSVIHSRTISIPKVPSLLRLLLKAKIGPDAKGGRHINAVTRDQTRNVSCGSPSGGCHTTSRILPELQALHDGNRLFRDSIASTNPGLLRTLAEQGQRM